MPKIARALVLAALPAVAGGTVTVAAGHEGPRSASAVSAPPCMAC